MLLNILQNAGWPSATRKSLVPSVKAEKLWAGTWSLQGHFRVSVPGSREKAGQIHRP